MRRLLACALLLSLWLAGGPARAEDAPQAGSEDGGYAPQAVENSAAAMLVSARSALRDVETPPADQTDADREVAFNSAIAALTGLYELHGCEWALPKLVDLRSRADCPDTHIGWSADGRISLMLQPLDLRNPAYDQYTIYMCTLSGNSAIRFPESSASLMHIELLDGTALEGEELNPEHALWKNLSRLAGTFQPQGELAPRLALVFKQIIAVPNLASERIARVELRWGKYQITVPYFENAQAANPE